MSRFKPLKLLTLVIAVHGDRYASAVVAAILFGQAVLFGRALRNELDRVLWQREAGQRPDRRTIIAELRLQVDLGVRLL